MGLHQSIHPWAMILHAPVLSLWSLTAISEQVTSRGHCLTAEKEERGLWPKKTQYGAGNSGSLDGRSGFAGRVVDTRALCIHQPRLSPSFSSRQTELPCTGPREQGTWTLCDCSWTTTCRWMTKTVYEGRSPLSVLQMCSVLGEC